jgi:hypothetical protein
VKRNQEELKNKKVFCNILSVQDLAFIGYTYNSFAAMGDKFGTYLRPNQASLGGGK